MCRRYASTTSSTHQHYKTILQRWSHRALIVNDTHNNQRKTEPNMVKRLQERAINRDFLEIICYDLITWNWETHKHFSDCNSMWSRIVVDCQIIYLAVLIFLWSCPVEWTENTLESGNLFVWFQTIKTLLYLISACIWYLRQWSGGTWMQRRVPRPQENARRRAFTHVVVFGSPINISCLLWWL